MARNFKFAGSNFSDSSSDPQNKVPANKNYRKHVSRENLLKIYSNLNSLHKHTVTKKLRRLNCKLPLSFRNKTVYNELLVLHRVRLPLYCLKISVSIVRT